MAMNGKPNILWLILDCGRYDRIGAHGYHRPITPNIDRLIETGLDYTYAISPSIWSLPSYTSLLTGLYPRQHGVNSKGSALNSNVVTLAQRFQRAKYATACFSNNAWLAPTFGVGCGFDRFDTMWYSAQRNAFAKLTFLSDKLWGTFVGNVDKGARRTNYRILEWLRSKRDEPTFTFVAYMELHMPYSNHRSLLPTVAPRHKLRFAQKKTMEISWIESLPAPHEFAPGLLEEVNLRYDLEMRYIDGVVGDLLTQLKQEKLLEKTIVIITADHGDILGEHSMLGHQWSVSEQLRHVPLIIWAPWIWSQSKKITDIVQTLDLPATICHWANIRWEVNGEGHLLPDEDGLGRREFAITDYPEPHLDLVRKRYPDKDLSSIAVGLTCVSDKRYKVIYTTKGEWSGFDLATDPEEKNPLSISNHQVFLRLKSQLEQYLAAAPAVSIKQEEIPQELLNHLRALGYVE